MFASLRQDVRAVFEHDPAARNLFEVLTCYSGLHALILHRVAHALWRWHIPMLPRLLSQISRFFTGVEIHPGAQIGPGCFIDHGMGVVIGETSILGKGVLLYQGVTLGGTGKERGKRHPTLGDHVVVGAGAVVLGPITIGDCVRIGAGSVVVRPVPDDCTVVGVPAKVVAHRGEKLTEEQMLAHGNLPDPELQLLRRLTHRMADLEHRVREMEKQQSKIES